MVYKHLLARMYFLLVRILTVFVTKITHWKEREENTQQQRRYIFYVVMCPKIETLN